MFYKAHPRIQHSRIFHLLEVSLEYFISLNNQVQVHAQPQLKTTMASLLFSSTRPFNMLYIGHKRNTGQYILQYTLHLSQLWKFWMKLLCPYFCGACPLLSEGGHYMCGELLQLHCCYLWPDVILIIMIMIVLMIIEASLLMTLCVCWHLMAVYCIV